MQKPKFYWLTIVAYMLIPFCASIVSNYHIVRFFELSNYTFLAVTLASCAEFGALSALFGLTSLHLANKSVVWFIFIFLTLYQLIGNIYFSFDVLGEKLSINSKFMQSFIDLFGFDVSSPEDIISVKRIISIVEGSFLPIISLSFLHLLVTYVSKTGVAAKSDLVDAKELLNDVALDLTNTPTEISEPELFVEPAKENFEKFVDEKKKQLEIKLFNYLDLLHIFFKNGTAIKGDELDSYKDFAAKVGEEKYENGTIKLFITLLNYLKIIKASGDTKIALMDYTEAKCELEKYLSL